MTLHEIWKSRPPVTPWWMYQWLEDMNGARWSALPWWRKIAHSLKCWWLLWCWTSTPSGYCGGVRAGGTEP